VSNIETIRLAIPSSVPGGLDAERSSHFGRCDCFTIIDVRNGKQEEVSIIHNPPHVEGGCLGPVNLLADANVNAIAVGGIGMRPLLGFQSAGISVLLGQGTKVRETVTAYIKGELRQISEEETCSGH
jgi:predicted Fe-Mo cluster-binding NifX family protein